MLCQSAMEEWAEDEFMWYGVSVCINMFIHVNFTFPKGDTSCCSAVILSANLTFGACNWFPRTIYSALDLFFGFRIFHALLAFS